MISVALSQLIKDNAALRKQLVHCLQQLAFTAYAVVVALLVPPQQ